MTQLDGLLEKGYRIQISEHVTPDTVFVFTDPANHGVHEDGDTLVFHPLNYSYVTYDDPFIAHAINMGYIYKQIEKSTEEALKRLDKLVDDLNDSHEPQTLLFLPNVEITENPDGTFSMSAQPVGYMKSADFLVPYKED